MTYILMHKNIPVIELSLDEATGSIQGLGTVYHSAHLPVGIPIRQNAVDRAALNDWWIDRAIPASRLGVRRALETLKVTSTQLLLEKCLGLSLSDQYWIKPQGSDLSWSEVNFFEHSFSEDIGDALLGKSRKADGFDFHSPDNTSDGFLKKRWKIVNGKRCLLKSGSAPFMQQPFNEVIATKLAERLEIPHVAYDLLWDGDEPYSVCEDFITPDTELVSAWRIMQTVKKRNDISVYQHYLDCCEAAGVSGIVHAVDQMIVLDYILANEDRHQNNFGLVRDANTLRWIGAAPIFDSGSSLGYAQLRGQILSGRGTECKPFKKTHEEQIKLVSSYDWIVFDRLKGFGEEIRAVLDQAKEYVDENRIPAIASAAEKRIQALESLAVAHTKAVDRIEQDVTEDRAENYTPKTPHHRSL